MLQDYWIPISASAAEHESLGINRAYAWGLRCADVPTDWAHLLNGLSVNWRKGIYDMMHLCSSEAFNRIYVPARALHLDPLVIWTRVCAFDKGDLQQLSGSMDKTSGGGDIHRTLHPERAVEMGRL